MFESLQALGERRIQEALEQLNQKYQDRLYVNRLEPERLFDRFFRSDKKLFLILGESGSGKTNLMCHLAQSSASRQPTIFVAGMWNWQPHADIWEYLLKPIQIDSGDSEISFDKWFAALRNRLKEQNQEMIIFIDGINETDDTLRVKKGLRMALESGPSWVRFVLSSRIDSFRLHYRDVFWKDYLYNDFATDSSTDPAANIQTRLEALITEQVRRRLSPEERKKIDAAISRYQQEIAYKKQVLARNSVDASVLLGTFNEIEFNEALRKYGIVATITGEAWNTCHDPLMFRFFADTEGKKDLEVSEVFTVDTCQNYLNLRIIETEKRPPNPSQEEINDLLYRLANVRRAERSHNPHASRKYIVPPGNEREKQVVESLVESGLLIWRQQTSDGEQKQLNFSFDRILSYVLALQVYGAGLNHVMESLSSIVKRKAPNEIEIHEANYLLLFLDRDERQERPQKQSVHYWVQRFLKNSSLRPQVIRLLPDLRTWSNDQVFSEIERILTDPYEDMEITSQPNVAVQACAIALTKLIQRDKAARAISIIEKVLNGVSGERQREVFYPLVAPVAASFSASPENNMKLLERLCELEREFNEESFNSSYQREYLNSYANRIQARPGSFGSDGKGIEVLKREITNFPNARLQLVLALSKSPNPILRTVSIFALPGLAASSAAETKKLLQSLSEDYDSLVRASLPPVLPLVAAQDEATTIELAIRLWEDKDTGVRGALAQAAIDFCLAGNSQANPLVETLAYDESSDVRLAFARYLVYAYESQTDDGGKAGALLSQLLQILASDKSNLVRASLIQAVFQSHTFDKFLAFDLLLLTLSDNPSRVLKKALLSTLERTDFSEVNLSKASDTVSRIASVFANDEDEEVRRRAIPLIIKLAEAGAEGCQKVLMQLLQDPDISVRMRVLSVYENMSGTTFDSILSKIDPEPIAATKGSNSLLKRWIVSFTDAKIASLDLRAKINRFFALLSASALILPILLAFSLSGWAHPWLGADVTGAALADPRVSLMPIVLGIFSSVLLYGLQRAMDFHFYSHYSTTLFRSLWVAFLFPFLAGILAVVLSCSVTSLKLAWLFGMISFCLASLFIVPFISSSSFEFAWVVCAGIIAGAVSGIISAYTLIDLYYPLCLLICPILLSVFIRPETHKRIAGLMGAGALLSVVSIIAPLINNWTGLSESKINQYVNNLWLGTEVALPLLSVTIVALILFFIYVLAESEEATLVAATITGGLILLIAIVFNLHKATSLHVALLPLIIFPLFPLLDDFSDEWKDYLMMAITAAYLITVVRLDGPSPLWLAPVAMLGIAGLLGHLMESGPGLRGYAPPAILRKPPSSALFRLRQAIVVAFAAAPLLYWVAELCARLWLLVSPDSIKDSVLKWGPLLAAALLGALISSVSLIFGFVLQQMRWRFFGFILLNSAILIWLIKSRDPMFIAILSIIFPLSLFLLNLVYYRKERLALLRLSGSVLLPVVLVGISIWSGSKYVGHFALFLLILGLLVASHRINPEFSFRLGKEYSRRYPHDFFLEDERRW